MVFNFFKLRLTHSTL